MSKNGRAARSNACSNVNFSEIPKVCQGPGERQKERDPGDERRHDADHIDEPVVVTTTPRHSGNLQCRSAQKSQATTDQERACNASIGALLAIIVIFSAEIFMPTPKMV